MYADPVVLLWVGGVCFMSYLNLDRHHNASQCLYPTYVRPSE
jgi:hypothetical protein